MSDSQWKKRGEEQIASFEAKVAKVWPAVYKINGETNNTQYMVSPLQNHFHLIGIPLIQML